mmetsp:Transcript_4008/g.11181  ORF Transcript_4008/g.11181 Transcript_4008/m.11181 type:complete len:222 (+) Transcript_4008:1487-2152(+)
MDREPVDHSNRISIVVLEPQQSHLVVRIVLIQVFLPLRVILICTRAAVNVCIIKLALPDPNTTSFPALQVIVCPQNRSGDALRNHIHIPLVGPKPSYIVKCIPAKALRTRVCVYATKHHVLPHIQISESGIRKFLDYQRLDSTKYHAQIRAHKHDSVRRIVRISNHHRTRPQPKMNTLGDLQGIHISHHGHTTGRSGDIGDTGTNHEVLALGLRQLEQAYS